MIPKIIHYCWFGGNEEPEDVKKCIASWRKFLPDYEIRRWDETNYDVNKCQYMADAYKEKKWAFVSDYARIDVVCEYGGIYLDTDVEVIRSFDDLLSEQMFCGFESRDPIGYKHVDEVEYSINLGLGYGAEKGHIVLKQIMELYHQLNFYNEDGTLNLVACPRYQTQILCNFGLIPNNKTQRLSNCIAYSPEYFCPQSNISDRMIYPLDKSYSIHHFTITWAPKRDVMEYKLRGKYIKYLPSKMASLLAKVVCMINY